MICVVPSIKVDPSIYSILGRKRKELGRISGVGGTYNMAIRFYVNEFEKYRKLKQEHLTQEKWIKKLLESSVKSGQSINIGGGTSIYPRSGYPPPPPRKKFSFDELSPEERLKRDNLLKEVMGTLNKKNKGLKKTKISEKEIIVKYKYWTAFYKEHSILHPIKLKEMEETYPFLSKPP